MEGARVLIVEDNGLAAEGIQAMLNEMGYKVPATVASGEEVVPAVTEHRPDLVLMDIRLEGTLDGIEAARLLRASGVPVVYLTAHSDSATLRRAKESEPFGYLVKPVQEVELRAAIEIALHKHRADRQAREFEGSLHEIRRHILQQLLTAREEQERAMRECLHEQIAQTVATLRVAAQRGQQAASWEEARAVHQEIAGHCSQALLAIRRLVDGLRPSLLDHLGLTTALESLVEQMARPAGIAVDLRLPAVISGALPADVETALYRIAEEALANVVRHASARHVSLALRLEPAAVQFEIRDDGIGFDADGRLRRPLPTAMGLILMRERVELLSGSMDIDSHSGGTGITVLIPRAATQS